MAVDMFLKLEGIEGEAKDNKHAKEIDIESFSWGMAQTGGFSSGGGGGAGKVSITDMSFMKFTDKSTAPLMAHCCSGKHIPTGQVIVRKAGDKPLEYMKIELFDILVSSVQVSGSGGSDRVTESLSLNFSKFKVAYQEQKPDGSGTPGGNMGWDIKANTKV